MLAVISGNLVNKAGDQCHNALMATQAVRVQALHGTLMGQGVSWYDDLDSKLWQNYVPQMVSNHWLLQI